jgi:tRNA dimethylallyltransferase
MEQITQSGKIPLLVGGTMLYFRALQNGLSQLPESDPSIRAALHEEANQIGWDAMHQQLLDIDPEAGARIHPNDPQRILRALEVFRISGQILSKLQAENRGDILPYRVLKLARAPVERAVLHQRIEQRFLKMLDDGFEAEVRALWSKGGLTTDLPAMRSVGYRQMLNYILGEWDYPTMIEKGIVATRQLAKRQYTWLRSEPEVNWLDESGDILAQALKKIEAARI